LMFYTQYSFVLMFALLSFGLSTVILGLSLLVSAKADDAQKLSAYECGFNPFDDSKTEFNVKFYIISILFIIFDLEISFLFPFSTCSNSTLSTGLSSMVCFLVVLTIGFIYE
jgi:NADH:ubiquinone oxidoreductase subunit 3 (subunit A)